MMCRLLDLMYSCHVTKFCTFQTFCREDAEFPPVSTTTGFVPSAEHAIRKVTNLYVYREGNWLVSAVVEVGMGVTFYNRVSKE